MDDPGAHSIVLDVMKEKLSQKSQEYRSEPFCVIDLGDIYHEYQRWSSLLPKVKPFYGWSLYSPFPFVFVPSPPRKQYLIAKTIIEADSIP